MLKTATFHDHGNRVNRSRILWYLANRGVGVLIRDQGVAALQHGKGQPTSPFLRWAASVFARLLITSQAADAMSYYITTSTSENHSYFLLFKNGEEPGFNYVYAHLYKPVLYYANRITGDEFANHTIVQEAFLRAWQFRERMTSMLHLFRFIRLCTRWGCYDYFRQPANRFYRQLIHPEYLEDFKSAAYDPEIESENASFSAMELERVNLVKNAIPYLPGNRQTIMTLYFRYGLSLKEIASRFAAPYQHISQEVQESISALKSMILRVKMQELACQVTSGSSPPSRWKELLTDQQIKICQLRLEQQYGFDRIAQELNIPMWQALKEYVSAHEILKSAKR